MRRILIPIAVLAAALPVAGARAAEIVEYEQMVTMSDGVRLDASVYLPSEIPAGVELPLIVRQHGGGSNKDSAYDVEYGKKYVETGTFAVLLYSHRGHGNSEGTFDFFGARTTQDASEMLDWVEATFGSQIDTNNVGMNGYSQGGGESLLPAEHDARVKAVAVGQTFADLNEALNPNDCVKLSFSLGIFALAYKSALADTDDVTAVRWGAHLYTDTEDVPNPVAPGGMSATQEMRAHSPIAYLDKLTVPTFWAQAWEDQLFPGDHPEMILEPLRAKGVPVHYWFSSGGHAAAGNFPAEVEAREAAMRDWFDEFLRGVDHGYGSGATPLVDYWERTAPGKPGTWEPHASATYPVTSSTRTFVTYGSDVLAEPQPCEGYPCPTPPTQAQIVNDLASANLANDPIMSEVDNQSRGRGGPPFGEVTAQAPEGPDPANTATFTSAPLSAPFTIAGAPTIRLAYDTTATRVAQVTAKVWDVAPSGVRTLISKACLSIEDLPSPARWDLWPNAHTFRAAHRVQLTLSAVDEPTFKADTEPQVMRISGAALSLPMVGSGG